MPKKKKPENEKAKSAPKPTKAAPDVVETVQPGEGEPPKTCILRR